LAISLIDTASCFGYYGTRIELSPLPHRSGRQHQNIFPAAESLLFSSFDLSTVDTGRHTMGDGSHVHQEQDADQLLTPHQDVEDQASVNQQDSPANAARSLNAPGTLAPKQVLALQGVVRHRAVQRHLALPAADAADRQVDSANRYASDEDYRAATLYLGAATKNLIMGTEKQ
jgi:hypothetical protein